MIKLGDIGRQGLTLYNCIAANSFKGVIYCTDKIGLLAFISVSLL